MQLAADTWLPLGAALGIGLLIGLERERRKGEGPRRVSAGIRTFAITALLGAGAVLVGGDALLAVAALGVGGLAIGAYWRSLAEDPGITSGIALLLTLLLGGLAMRDAPAAVALAVTVTALLASKARLHDFVRHVVTEAELNDALTLAAAALVVLPLIPDRYLGPFDAFNPRTAWMLVVLMMAVGAVGHVAQRLLGAGMGLAAAGFASGFVSSIATIGAMGERAVRTPSLMRPAVAGAVLSTLATVIQMAIVLAATSAATAAQMWLPLLCAGLAACLYAAIFTLRTIKAAPSPPAEIGHAFSLGKALGLALTVSAVMVASAALQAWFGHGGVVVATGIAGLVDAHAAAASVASLVAAGRLPATDAVVPILCGLTANTLSKLVVTLMVRSPRFTAQIIPGLVLLVVAAWLGFWLGGSGA